MATYYASPTGGGNGLTQGTPFQITNFWNVDAPGDTLILLDGEYTGANSMIDPPDVASNAGTSGNPITIKALNDGQVLINGQFARRPLRLRSNNDWFIIEGINCKNSSLSNVTIGAGCSDVIIRRVCAWDTNSGGNYQGIENAGTRVLIEDCFFFGRGRKAMGRLGDVDGTFRRCVGMKTENPQTGAGTDFIGMTISCGYESIRARTENCIAFEDMQVVNAGQSNQHILATDHWANWSGSGAVAVEILGCIAYHYDAQETIADRVMRLSTNPASIQPNTTVTTKNRDNLAVRRSSADPATGIQWLTGGNGTTTGISVADTDWWTDSVGTLAGGTNTTEDGTRTLTQLGGSLIQEQATTRPTSGAWVRNRYVDGTLTSTPLWPWPMRQRIIDAFALSPYAAIGLDGNGETDIHVVIENLTGANLTTFEGAQNYYLAATGGSDSNPGTEAQPFATIGKLLSVMQAGDTGYLRTGTHGAINTDTNTVPSGTSWSNAVTFRAYSGEVATIPRIKLGNTANTYIIFSGLVIDATGQTHCAHILGGADFIRLEGCELKNSTDIGIYITQTATGFCEILTNHIHDVGGFGIGCVSHDCLIGGNLIEDFVGHGISIEEIGATDHSNNTIFRNRITGGTGASNFGITVANGANNKVYTNVVDNNAGGGIRCGADGVGTEVHNNTIYNNAGGPGISILSTNDGSNVIRNNIVYQNQSGIVDSRGDAILSNNLTIDPLFVNAGAGDFTLQVTSPAREAGVPISFASVDFIGTARPVGSAWDIGAFEYVLTGSEFLTPSDFVTTAAYAPQWRITHNPVSFLVNPDGFTLDVPLVPLIDVGLVTQATLPLWWQLKILIGTTLANTKWFIPIAGPSLESWHMFRQGAQLPHLWAPRTVQSHTEDVQHYTLSPLPPDPLVTGLRIIPALPPHFRVPRISQSFQVNPQTFLSPIIPSVEFLLTRAARVIPGFFGRKAVPHTAQRIDGAWWIIHPTPPNIIRAIVAHYRDRRVTTKIGR